MTQEASWCVPDQEVGGPSQCIQSLPQGHPLPMRPHIPGNRKTCSLKATTQPFFLSEQQRRMLFVNALFIYGSQKNMPPQGILSALSLNVSAGHTKAGVVSAFHALGVAAPHVAPRASMCLGRVVGQGQAAPLRGDGGPIQSLAGFCHENSILGRCADMAFPRVCVCGGHWHTVPLQHPTCGTHLF